jgi:hypothetical protein
MASVEKVYYVGVVVYDYLDGELFIDTEEPYEFDDLEEAKEFAISTGVAGGGSVAVCVYTLEGKNVTYIEF